MRFLLLLSLIMMSFTLTFGQENKINVVVIGAHPDDADTTTGGTAIKFAGMCIPYMLIVWKLMPETAGKSLEDIERFWLKQKTILK